MKNNAKETQPFIYLRATGQKVPVRRELHDAYYAGTARIRMEERSLGRCICPQHQVWACDGDCLTCEHHRTGELVSLDVPVEAEDCNTLLDMVPSEVPPVQRVVADRDLLDRLFARLRELDPDADTIIAMWMADDRVSDRAIAEALGRPQHTFAVQMEKYRAELRLIRGS